MKHKVHLHSLFSFNIFVLFSAFIFISQTHASSDSFSGIAQKDEILLGGPGSVTSQIKHDQKAKEQGEMLFNEMTFKEELKEKWGLSLHFDYNILYQHSNESDMNNSNASGGVARFYGVWKPFGVDSKTGQLVFKIENRHRLGTDIAPKQLGSEFGYAGLTAVTFSDAGTILSNLYWSQSFNDNRFGFYIGLVDVTDYFDVYGLVNMWVDFNDLSFTTNPTVPTPSQGFGAVGYWLLTPNIYVHAGLADANGDPTRPEKSLKSFFDDAEYFKHIEFGWIPSWDKRFVDNVHISLWQVDERKKENIDDGWGFVFSFSDTFDEKWLPFLRAGYAEGGGAIVDRSITSGVGYKVNDRNDYIGFGIGWARASDDTYDTNKKNQYTSEIYYRLQLFPKLQIAPSIQYIHNPVYSTDIDDVLIGSIRLRAVF